MVSAHPVLIWLAAATLLAAAQPQRIVSTAPSVTEMLYALGLGDKVVGVTTFCHYPPEAMQKPKIGDYMRPNIEAVLAARPDLVIVETTGIRQTGQLPAFKLNVLEVDDGTIPGIYRSLERIGAATGVPERAAALNVKIRSGLAEIQERTGRLPKRRAMFVLGRTPGRLEDIIVAGKGSYLDEILRLAGAENTFGDSAAMYGRVSLEEVLARNPEVIFDMGDMAQTAAATEEWRRSVRAMWGRHTSIAAVRRGAVFAVASDAFVVPGPRVVEAARALTAMIHPEAGF